MSAPVGLIAGQGQLPMFTARGIRAAGRAVACVGLRHQFDPPLEELCDHFAVAGITRVGRWIRLLRRWGVREVVMVGRVRKNSMYDPWRFVRDLPDWRAAKIWFIRQRHDRRSGRLLSALADELAAAGVPLIDSTRYIPDQMAPAGVLTRRPPSAGQRADLAFALPILRRLGELDIGQTLAVRDREVIAVEAMEGTDALIRRAGELCRSRGWTLVKAPRPGHDMRFDVPTIGTQSIALLAQCGASCLAVEAGRVILLDQPRVIEAANRAGLAIVGFEASGSGPAPATMAP